MSTANSESTIPVRKGEDLDWPALGRYLKTALPHLEGTPTISQFAGGKSNLTYQLKYDNDDLVVRRPPFGTKSKTAHSMIREYRVMSDLKPVYPCVPETLCYSDDESIIGSEFYVMRKVEGLLVGNQIPVEWKFTAEDTRRFCTGFWEKLIELHQVDYIAAGLGEFGKPQGYVERQVLGWNRRFEKALTPDVDHFRGIREWLVASMPAESNRHSILHGDFRIDNVILDKQDPCNVLAVLDWEICALGDPLMDLGNSLAYWIQDDDPREMKQLLVQPSNAPGMLSRGEILDLYQERTGIDTSGFNFYRVYGYWRLAVICNRSIFAIFMVRQRTCASRLLGKLLNNWANIAKI